MLKTNLDSRNQLMARLNRIDNDQAMSNDADHKSGDKAESSSKVSSLEKHKKKKS
jgi:hypothetical protein